MKCPKCQFDNPDGLANAEKKEKALENLKKAEVMFQEMGMDYNLTRTRKLLETL
jgi:hypothetical protein